MEPSDPIATGDTVTLYDFAMEEIRVGSSNLARALLAHTLKKGAMPEKECADARRTYDKMIDLHPRLRLDESQRTELFEALAILWARIEECEHIDGRPRETPNRSLATGGFIHTDEFRVRSASGRTRIVVCSEQHIERGGTGAGQKMCVPSGVKTYKFKGGEPLARIGDAFLDRSGEIYQRIR